MSIDGGLRNPYRLLYAKISAFTVGTRTQVASETIQTTLSGSRNVNTSTAEEINFEQDIETNHALGDG